MERPRLEPYVLIALSFVGLADTLYLSTEQYLGQTPTCAILNGCDTVLHSVYSKFFGVPLAYIGLVFYAYMLGLAVLLAIDPHSKGLRFGAFAYAGIGLLCSIGFESIQAGVIHALCMYCAISALTTLALFITATIHFRAARSAVASASARL